LLVNERTDALGWSSSASGTWHLQNKSLNFLLQ